MLNLLREGHPFKWQEWPLLVRFRQSLAARGEHDLQLPHAVGEWGGPDC